MLTIYNAIHKIYYTTITFKISINFIQINQFYSTYTIALPSGEAQKCTTPVDFFSLFFKQDLKTLIHNETIRYGQQKMPSAEYLEKYPKARANEWMKKPMQEEEVDVFLAVIIIIGMLGFPRLR